MTNIENNEKDKAPLDVINMIKINHGDTEYTVVHRDHLQTYVKVPAVEEIYNAKYIGEFTLKTVDNGWANQPVMIFYTPIAHPEGSNYFGLFFRGDRLVITNGISAVNNIWDGVLDPESNHILYSAYRHDYQKFDNLIADGGPEYLRSSLHPSIKFKIKDGSLEIVEGMKENGENEENIPVSM